MPGEMRGALLSARLERPDLIGGTLLFERGKNRAGVRAAGNGVDDEVGHSCAFLGLGFDVCGEEAEKCGPAA